MYSGKLSFPIVPLGSRMFHPHFTETKWRLEKPGSEPRPNGHALNPSGPYALSHYIVIMCVCISFLVDSEL